MKKIIFLNVFLFFTFCSFGQELIENGGFDDVSQASGNCTFTLGSYAYAFGQGCLGDQWGAAQGSPDVRSSYSSSVFGTASPHSAPNFALMQITRFPCKRESFYYNQTLTKNIPYKLSFYVLGRGSKEVDLEVYATKNIINNPPPTVGSQGGVDCALNVPIEKELLPFEGSSISESGSWELITVNFTLDEDYEQIWFTPNMPTGDGQAFAMMIDDVSLEIDCNLINECRPIIDLNACVEEGNFGSIAFDCAGTYEWSLPAGSTALEFTTSTHSAILQASPGIYTLTYTDFQGCVYIDEFEIIEECCNIDYCAPPLDLSCEGYDGGVEFNWNEVAEASEYILTIIYDDDDCECGSGGGTITETITVDENEYFLEGFIPSNCFSWSVQAVCPRIGISASSEVMCFGGEGECYGIKGEGSLRNSRPLNNIGQEISNGELDVKVYPNPGVDEFNFILDIVEATELMIDLYDVNGKRVSNFYEAEIGKGRYHKRWSPGANLPSGIYLARFQTNVGTATKTIIVSK